MTSIRTTKREFLIAAVILGLILNAVFFPAMWGGKTLLSSSWDAPSIMPSGAYGTTPVSTHIGHTPDPGAPAWQTEPWLKIISNEMWQRHDLPLWNPYSAYGTPLAAAMQPQPFYPLTALVALDPTPWTYNLFILGRLFVAGLLMFLFARLFLELLPSLAAAVTFMLTGYFVLYLDMPHLSVEVLLPGVLLTFELLLRRNSWGAAAGAAFMIFLCSTGGMPESLFLVLGFGTVYFLFRLSVTPKARQHFVSLLLKLAIAIGLGFALSAFLLLPFFEFLKVSHDTHQLANLKGGKPGLAADGDVRRIILNFLPLLFGPSTGLRAYWGVIPCLFATAAVLFGLRKRTLTYPSHLRLLTLFFSTALVLMLLKRFGSPLVNWIGDLPVADMVVFVKYQEPLMACCIAILTGIGFSVLVEKRQRPAYFVAPAGVVLIAMLALAGWSLPRVLRLPHYGVVFYLVLTAGILVVIAAVLLAFMPRLSRWWTWSFFGLLTLELCFNFIVPSFYMFGALPPDTHNPYAGAPYIDFLKTHDKGRYRIFGRDGVLYPNWAGAFELFDVRSLDGMYYRPYITFIRSFLLRRGDEQRLHGDLADRFTGSRPGYSYAFNSERGKRFLALSSVKYLVSVSSYNVTTKIVDDIIAQHQGEKIWGFGHGTFDAGSGKGVPGLFEHPPSHRITYKTVVDPKKPVFEGAVGINTDALDKTDGVKFLLEIKAKGAIKTLFTTFLNPHQIKADREGRKFRIDLSRYAGMPVELLFSTDVGPSGNNAYCWAGWANLRFTAAHPDKTQAEAEPQLIYNKEVNIYAVPNVLPRASIFFSAEVLPQDQILSRLKEPAFNIRQRVILTRDSLSDQVANQAEALAHQPGAPIGTATITQYGPERVRIEADTPKAAILMLNDANYPGWHATVNGKPTPVLKADYLFRGIILPPGHNVVVFAYEPSSFRWGVLIAGGALALILVGGAVRFAKHARSARC